MNTLALVIQKKLTTKLMADENYGIRCLGLIDIVIDKCERWLEESNLGDKLENALIPVFDLLLKEDKGEMDTDIIELLNQVIIKRKSR